MDGYDLMTQSNHSLGFYMLIRYSLKAIHSHWLLLTGGILAAITLLSLWPLPNLPEFPGTDKTHHFIAYALLILPTAIRQPKYYWLIGLGMIGYGGFIELIQPYVNRYGEWLDFLANMGGVALGLGLGAVIRTKEF